MSLRFRGLISVTLIQVLAVTSLYWIAESMLLDRHKKLEQAQLEKVHQELFAGIDAMLELKATYITSMACTKLEMSRRVLE